MPSSRLRSETAESVMRPWRSASIVASGASRRGLRADAGAAAPGTSACFTAASQAESGFSSRTWRKL